MQDSSQMILHDNESKSRFWFYFQELFQVLQWKLESLDLVKKVHCNAVILQVHKIISRVLWWNVFLAFALTQDIGHDDIILYKLLKLPS